MIHPDGSISNSISPNVLELLKQDTYKESILNSLCAGIPEEYVESLKELLNYVVDKKLHLFDRVEFKEALYFEEDETLDLILPSIRRVFGKIFITPPTLFKSENSLDNRFKLFVLLFDIDEFIDYSIDMYLKTKGCLKEFQNIDKTVETLTLIVDNYVAGLVKKVRLCNNVDEEIELRKKKIQRNSILDNILEND